MVFAHNSKIATSWHIVIHYIILLFYVALTEYVTDDQRHWAWNSMRYLPDQPQKIKKKCLFPRSLSSFVTVTRIQFEKVNLLYYKFQTIFSDLRRKIASIRLYIKYVEQFGYIGK